MGKVLHASVVSEGLLNSILNKFTLFTLLYIIFLCFRQQFESTNLKNVLSTYIIETRMCFR